MLDFLCSKKQVSLFLSLVLVLLVILLHQSHQNVKEAERTIQAMEQQIDSYARKEEAGIETVRELRERINTATKDEKEIANKAIQKLKEQIQISAKNEGVSEKRVKDVIRIIELSGKSSPWTSVDKMDFVWQRLVPPASRDTPYNLIEPETKFFSQYGQDKFVSKVLRNKPNGFFVEAGAYDGEKFSNTLYFERERGWTGLLVEPVPESFQALQTKRRKAYSINACLSNTDSAGIMKIEHSSNRLTAQLNVGGKISERSKLLDIPCYPLLDLLTELGNPIVDFFSLDIEGFEMKVLKNIPWDSVKIRLIGIEINHVPEGKAAVKEYMEQQGFKFYKRVNIDYFFYKPELADDMDLSFIDTRKL